MANPYFGFVRNITSDGTNIWVDYEICDGNQTFPLIRASFPADMVSATTIHQYLQNILNGQPTIPQSIRNLTNIRISGQ